MIKKKKGQAELEQNTTNTPRPNADTPYFEVYDTWSISHGTSKCTSHRRQKRQSSTTNLVVSGTATGGSHRAGPCPGMVVVVRRLASAIDHASAVFHQKKSTSRGRGRFHKMKNETHSHTHAQWPGWGGGKASLIPPGFIIDRIPYSARCT